MVLGMSRGLELPQQLQYLESRGRVRLHYFAHVAYELGNRVADLAMLNDE
jgi:hypothetical protein